MKVRPPKIVDLGACMERASGQVPPPVVREQCCARRRRSDLRIWLVTEL